MTSIPFSNETLILELKNYTSRELFIKYEKYIPLYSCFYYLHETPLENKSEQVSYNEIIDNFKDRYSIEHIKKVFDIVAFNKTNVFTYKQIMKNIYCDGLCGECESNEHCF
uniref:Uncharacterized protein n=1 Tax=viral metagenome TaxID=1070528 RepID=A0A6C0HNR3_9ZZZZ